VTRGDNFARPLQFAVYGMEHLGSSKEGCSYSMQLRFCHIREAVKSYTTSQAQGFITKTAHRRITRHIYAIVDLAQVYVDLTGFFAKDSN